MRSSSAASGSSRWWPIAPPRTTTSSSTARSGSPTASSSACASRGSSSIRPTSGRCRAAARISSAAGPPSSTCATAGLCALRSTRISSRLSRLRGSRLSRYNFDTNYSLECEYAVTDLLLVPLEDTVVFPGMNVTLTVDVGDENRVVLVPRHENEYAAVGTIAEVTDHVRIRGGGHAVSLEGLHRGVIGAAHSDALGQLRAEVEERPDENPPPVQTRELEREYRAVVEEILDLRGADDRVREFLRAISEAGALADTCAYAPDVTFAQRVELLETVDVVERLQLSLAIQKERLAELQVRRRIRDDVEEGAQKQQREWFLRQQMNSIRKELGEDEGSVLDEYRTKIEEAGMPDEVRAQAERELRRLETMGENAEASMIRTYLDWLVSVPWSKRSDETLDPTAAREVLDADHAGLDDVKDRIVEYLAVRKLRQDRGIPNDKKSGAILTLIGPPGTGKTSIGESVARALNREFVRMSLGGVRDEAEIRGHRRTYIGALPGRLVRALRDAGTMNPVILLDEVDKVGADWRGDPSAALLEVLDPAQ